MAGETSSSSAERNSFTLPWNGSDIILVVESWELYVHKAILSLQSPVFRAMFDGQFQEATAERVTLDGKTHKWVLQFLRLLYPANMIKDAKVIITDENVFEILKLADEYQASNVVSQCLAEVNLTNENVLQLVPYAVRHDQSALGRLNQTIGTAISVEKLGKFVLELSDNKAAHEIIVSKGLYMEYIVFMSYDVIEGLVSVFAKNLNALANTAYSVQCGHTVNFSEFYQSEDAVKCKTFQSQQRENLEFLEQERKGLEETTFELEQQVKSRTEELEVTRQALEEKTRHYEETRATVQILRGQLSDLQDELDAVQSQAYLLMLEQEKELTAGSRVLEESWERLVTLVQTYKEHVRVQEESAAEQDSEEISKDEYKPSFVYSVLAAVSGTGPQSDDIKELPSEKETTPDNIEVIAIENQASDSENHDLSDDFSLVSRAKAFQNLFSELESYVQDRNEHAQMIIQRQVDEIANLAESLREAKQQHEEQITNLKQELESKGCKIKEVQRENDNKLYEIESLKLELKTVEENFEASRENMKELGDRCCSLIEQETENQVLNEKLRLINHELEKVKQDKTCLEKELSESLERLQSLVEASEENDKEKMKTVIEETFTEILDKKLHLEREVEKLRSSFAKALRENETFAQYNARLENKASILGSNLLRAEEEIYRLDGIVDRFCTATQINWKTMTPSQDLRDLLKELRIVVE